MRKKMAIALRCAATLLGLCGLLWTGPHTQAQTTTDQTEKTTKKKKKKSAKSTEAPSAAATPAPTPAEAATSKKKATAETAEAEKTTKKKKSKKSATEVPSQSFVPPGNPPSKAEESAPPVRNATAGQIRSAQSSGMVWVNTDSGVYHKGGRWYGNTKQGKFMTEDEAVRAGYRAAQNEK